MPRALIFIAQQGYQDVELKGTRDGLETAGFSITLTSKEAGECVGKYDGRETADIAMRDVHVMDFDCIAFIGGPGAGAYANDGDALQLANDAVRADKIVGAICIAPTILAKARLLEGKHATVFESDEAIATLKEYGALYTGDSVTVDGKIVTGNGPKAAEEFGVTLAKMAS